MKDWIKLKSLGDFAYFDPRSVVAIASTGTRLTRVVLNYGVEERAVELLVTGTSQETYEAILKHKDNIDKELADVFVTEKTLESIRR